MPVAWRIKKNKKNKHFNSANGTIDPKSWLKVNTIDYTTKKKLAEERRLV